MAKRGEEPAVALEDLQEAISQVVLLQNVKRTLVEEIDRLKTVVCERDQAIERLQSVQDTRTAVDPNALQAARRDVEDARSKAHFAEEAMRISVSEKEALLADLNAAQLEIESMRRDTATSEETVESRNALITEQLEQVTKLEDALNAKCDELLAARESLAATERELERVARTEADGVSRSEAARKIEVDMLEKQLEKLQNNNSALSTELGTAKAKMSELMNQVETATARVAEVEETANAKVAHLERDATVSSELQNKVSVAHAELQVSQTTIFRLEARVKELEEGQRECNAELAAARKELQDTLSEQALQDKAHAAAAAQVKDAGGAVQKLRAIERELEDQQQETQKLRLQIQTVSSESTMLKAELTKARAEANAAVSVEDFSQLEQKLEAEQSRTKLLEAKLLKREAESMAAGGDRGVLESKITALKGELDEMVSARGILRTDLAVAHSKNEELADKLKQNELLCSSLRKQILATGTDLQAANTALENCRAEGEAIAIKHASEISALHDSLAKMKSKAEQLNDDCGLRSQQLQTTENRLTTVENELRLATEKCESLQSTLGSEKSSLADAKRQIEAKELKLSTQVELAEQQKMHQCAIIDDYKSRIEKLEKMVKESRSEGDAEVLRVKEQLERLRQDYTESAANTASMERQLREASKHTSRLQEDLNEAKLTLSTNNRDAETRERELKEAQEQLAKAVSDSSAHQKAAHDAKKQYETAYTQAHARMQEQLVGLQRLYQQQSEENASLAGDLEALEKTGGAKAQALLEENNTLREQLREARSEIQRNADEFSVTVTQLRDEAVQESERHDKSHGELAHLLSTLKSELEALTKKKTDLSDELNQKDDRLEAALDDAHRLRDQCKILESEKQTWETKAEQAERELQNLKDAEGQSQEAAHIASTLGSDTELLRQLHECKQELARLKMSSKHDSPKEVRRGGGIDIKLKLQLSTAQAQVKKLSQEKADLERQLRDAGKILRDS